MKIIRILLMGFIGSLATVSIAQQDEIDSLRKVLPEQDDPAIIAEINKKIGYRFLYLNPDSCDYYNRISIRQAKAIENNAVLSAAHKTLGDMFYLMGQFDSALYHVKTSIGYNRLEGDLIREAIIFQTLGNVYSKIGEYDSAYAVLERSVPIFRDNPDYFIYQGLAYNNLGLIGLDQGNYIIASDYFHKALAIHEDLGQEFRSAIILGNIGVVYENLNEYDKALEIHSRCYNVFKKTEDLYRQTESLYNGGLVLKKLELLDTAAINFRLALEKSYLVNHDEIISLSLKELGDLFLIRSELDSSLFYLRSSLNLAEKIKNPLHISSTMAGIGMTHQKAGQLDSARYYLENAYQQAKENDLEQVKKDASKSLSEVYESIGDTRNALIYYKAYTVANEKIFNEENIRKLANIEAQYEFDKKEQEQAIIRNKEVTEARWVRNTSIGGALIATILAIIIFINLRRKKRDNEKLNLLYSQVEQQANELKELDKTKSRFFSNISHELRTPLTLISSPLQYILNSEDSEMGPDVKKELDLMNKNTEQLSVLVDDILSLSKLESGSLQNETSDIHIKNFLSRVFSNYKSLAEHLGLKYELNMDQLNLDGVKIDQFKLEKIINNLISNALKYTTGGGSISLTAWNENNNLHLKVEDSGQGIAPEDLPHIFDRFYQSKQPDAPIQGGTGIGLALAKELVGVMEGEIEAESTTGKGSLFSLHVPYKEVTIKDIEIKIESTSDDEEEVELLPQESLKDSKVLIVEDHPQMQEFIEKILSPEFECKLASNGKQALEVLESEKIDLIVTDVMMPEMDGHELLQKIRENENLRQIPVIMLTALKNEGSLLKALSTGVDDYLTKPFSPTELTARVKNMIIRYGIKRLAATEVVDESIDEQAPSYLQDSDKTIGEVKFIQELEAKILEELENEEFSINDLADEFHISYRQFVRNVKKATGLSPKQFQQEVALQKARELLEDRIYDNATTIAYAVGMNHVTRFSKLYEERFGKKPTSYFN